jgi:hypothetical protein
MVETFAIGCFDLPEKRPGFPSPVAYPQASFDPLLGNLAFQHEHLPQKGVVLRGTSFIITAKVLGTPWKEGSFFRGLLLKALAYEQK